VGSSLIEDHGNLLGNSVLQFFLQVAATVLVLAERIEFSDQTFKLNIGKARIF